MACTLLEQACVTCGLDGWPPSTSLHRVSVALVVGRPDRSCIFSVTLELEAGREPEKRRAVDDVEWSQLAASAAREMAGEPDVQHTLQRAVDLAAEHLDGEVFVSVSLVHKRHRVETPASSDDRASRADALQYELEEGPCLDAIRKHETFAIADMTTDENYPRWSRRVVEETGIRSSLSFQLFTSEDSLGALNVYSPHLNGFTDEDRAEGQVFAAQAAVALQAARTEEHLRSAMSTRNIIGQAQGILMERYKVDGPTAFQVLTRLSQSSNIKLHEVARRLIESGEIPRS